MGKDGLFQRKKFLGLGENWIEGIMDKSLLTQDLYDAIMADNNKFKEYWNIHPEEVEEVCRKFLKSMRICLRKDLLQIEVGLFSKVLSYN